MTTGDVGAVMAPAQRGCLSLERSFVILMVTTGVSIFFMASVLVQRSDKDIVRQYLATRRAYMDRYSRELAEAQDAVNTLVKGDTANTSGHTATEPPLSATGPQWLNETSGPVKPYAPADRQHPFIKGYVIENPAVCGESPVDLLIVIHSAVIHSQRRRILRETWAGEDVLQGLAVRRVFVLGRHGTDQSSQVGVNTEQATYGDIVQGDFVDTFPNLTRKAVTALRWVNDHCPQARFVVKTDDDVFLNVFRVMETLLQTLWGQDRAVMCYSKAAGTTRIERGSSSKWYVPPALLPGRVHWPAFCSGLVVIMTPDVVPALYQASFNSSYVPVDDGFVYGVLPALAWGDPHQGLRYINIGPNLTLSANTLLSHYRSSFHPLTYVGGSVNSETVMIQLWQALLNRLSPWAQRQASIVHLQKTMTPMVL